MSPRRPRPSSPSTVADETRTATSTDASDGGSETLSEALDARAFVMAEATAVLDRYEIGGEIARGGLGRILEAYDRELGRRVAVKELLEERRTAEARFLREAMITARLEHPAIVPVHQAGRWEDGKPFYVMKLVAGERLKEVIAAAGTRAERLALVPHVLAVADAVAYAHAEGVIHRDIKPSNVLVGAYGETVVIDWGLAKDLRGEVAETGPLVETAEAGSGDLTIEGAVLGTPAYMSPEQARGDEVDQRTDVYSIGAVLYHVVTGVAPYRAGDSHKVLELVRAEPPAPIAERAPDVPPDLIAIINRAMSRGRDDRYRDAGELAADLRRFQEGQIVGAHQYTTWQLIRRWTARHRGAVAVAAVMTVVLAVVAAVGLRRIARERDRAEAERAAAEEHRDAAEELVAFMLYDLRDRLGPIGKLDLLDLVVRKASEYYAERPVDWTRPEQAGDRAVAHTGVGDVLRARGKLDEAMAEYETAIALYEKLIAREPNDDSLRRNLALVHEEIGKIHRARGEHDEALAAYETYKEMFERLASDDDPDDQQSRREVSVALLAIGDIRRVRGDVEGGLASYRASIDILEPLVAAHPDDAVILYDLSSAIERIAVALKARDERDDALARYAEVRALREKVVDLDPSNATYKEALAIVRDNIGDVLALEEEYDRAFASYRAALAIREDLAARDPGNPRRVARLAGSYERAGYLRRLTAQREEALELLGKGIALRRDLIARFPSNTEWRSDLAAAENILGDVLHEEERFDEALAAYRRSTELRRELVAVDPTQTRWQRNLALGHNMLAEVYLDQGEYEAARDELRAGLAIREKLLAGEPTSVFRRREVAINQFQLARALAGLGEDDAAQPLFDEGAETYAELAGTGREYYIAATAYMWAGRHEDAFAMLDEAVEHGFREPAYAASDPDFAPLHGDPRWQRFLDAMGD